MPGAGLPGCAIAALEAVVIGEACCTGCRALLLGGRSLVADASWRACVDHRSRATGLVLAKPLIYSGAVKIQSSAS